MIDISDITGESERYKEGDVAVTEAVIGSGLVTSLFVFTLLSARKVGN